MKTTMKRILALAIALMLAIPGFTLAEGADHPRG